MKKRLFSVLAALLAGSGLAEGQGTYPVYPVPAPGHVAPYPAMPAPYGLPGGHSSIGRASVGGDVKTPPPAPVGGPVLMPMPPVKSAAAKEAPAKSPEKGPLRPASASDKPVLPPRHTPGTLTSGGKHHQDPACHGCAVPGAPMLWDLNACGQPIIDRELDRQPRGYKGYARADFLYWWVDNQSSPELLRLTSLRGTSRLFADDLDNGERIGARTVLGIWADPHHRLAFELGFTWLANRSPLFTAGTPTIQRPFFNAVTGQNELFPVALAGTSIGGARLESHMRFHTFEANLRHELCCFGCGHLDVIGGFRYLRLAEDLNVETATFPNAGGYQLSSDRFDSDNQFFGGQIGVEGEVNWGRFFVNPFGKCAFGYNNQYISINGNRVGPDANGVARSVDGGFLALPTNIGTYRQGEFGFVPEFGLNLGYRITENLRFTAGYTAILLSNAARASDQINTSLNLTTLQAPGGPPANPVAPLSPLFNGIQDGVFWVQGVNFGMEFRW